MSTTRFAEAPTIEKVYDEYGKENSCDIEAIGAPSRAAAMPRLSRKSSGLSMLSRASFGLSRVQTTSENITPRVSRELKLANRDYYDALGFHKIPLEELCAIFSVNPSRGLNNKTIELRQQRDGLNGLPTKRSSIIRKLLKYVFGGFCSILWIGVIVFFLCWQPLSSPPSVPNLALAILVLIVIALQAMFAAFQDWSTQRVMNSILNMVPSETMVTRNGNLNSIDTSQLVVGDIVHLSAGNKVPADMRIIKCSHDLRFDRSMLTGESQEVEGTATSDEQDFHEAKNIALMGTNVVRGKAIGIVVFTGARTVMGRLAAATYTGKEKKTLIQKEIDRFVLIIVCLTIALVLAIVLTWALWLRVKFHSYMTVAEMLSTVMGCVVAFIPEGMPIGVALTLMNIAKRMKEHKILPKGLSTVETLGCVNVICSDKTGTLTQNRMTVVSVGSAESEYAVEDVQKRAQADQGAFEAEIYKVATLCNESEFEESSAHLPIEERKTTGNATDAGMLRFAENILATKTTIEQYECLHTLPFNSTDKYMATVQRNKASGDTKLFVKGAPDVLLPLCSSFLSQQQGKPIKLEPTGRTKLVAMQESWAQRAERTLLLCERQMDAKELESLDKAPKVSDLTIVGMVGIIDPPKPDARMTVRQCQRAGIRVFMITGDFGITAAAIAKKLEIFTSPFEPDRLDPSGGFIKTHEGRHSLLVEGPLMANLTEFEWCEVCSYEEIVFARTTPEQKLKIVQELRKRDNVVAMTGDGCNDAPSIKEADVGIAIASGNDVAMEAADLILLGEFSSIIEGIRLGRLVFQNLQKTISYLLPAGSYSEIWPVILNVWFGVPLALSSFLMIIICVFTDLFCSLSLIVEKEEFDLLSLPPRNRKKERLITARLYMQAYGFIGSMEALCASSMYFLYYWLRARIPVRDLFFAFNKYTQGFHGYTEEQLTSFNYTGQSVYFVTLVILQWGNILSIRNKRLSIFQADPFTQPQRRNLWIFAAMVVALCIALVVVLGPGIHSLFLTSAMPLKFWFLPLPLALGILVMDELRKLIVRKFPRSVVAKAAW